MYVNIDIKPFFTYLQFTSIYLIVYYKQYGN